MLDSFEQMRIETGDVGINLRTGGSGPPVLLLHGYPQTHVMWHLVAPRLAERFTVVVPDLRGYGDSSKPVGGADHAAYSKRVMVGDQVEVMAALGHDRFAVVGHDRGGRVGHRMALDHPDKVSSLTVLDIVPTRTVFSSVNQEIATGTYHWFFLIQPDPLPERLIGADPGFFLRWHLKAWSGGRDDFFAADALAEYQRCFSDPACIHATCEDYRAAASIDLVHDVEDASNRVECPLQVLWGARGKNDALFDMLASWRTKASTVSGRGLDCGHFLPEELPEETAHALLEFLG
jgi:haloacetate dehalogenase